MCWVTHILTCVHVCVLISRVQLFETPWTVAQQAPMSMGFPKQEYWSGLPFTSPVDLPDPRIKPSFPVSWADSLMSETPRNPNIVTYII